jgi:hypothetical protein
MQRRCLRFFEKMSCGFFQLLTDILFFICVRESPSSIFDCVETEPLPA